FRASAPRLPALSAPHLQSNAQESLPVLPDVGLDPVTHTLLTQRPCKQSEGLPAIRPSDSADTSQAQAREFFRFSRCRAEGERTGLVEPNRLSAPRTRRVGRIAVASILGRLT